MSTQRNTLALVSVMSLVLGAGAVARAKDGFFEDVKPLENIDSDPVGVDGRPSISRDGLKLYFFASDHRGGAGEDNLYVVSRAYTNLPFEEEDVQPLEELNTEYWDRSPHISANALTLYFVSTRPPTGAGESDLWFATRADKSHPFGPPERVRGADVNTAYYEVSPSVSENELELYFESWRPNPYGGPAHPDLYVATRNAVGEPFGVPSFLQKLNDDGFQRAPYLSADGNTLFYVDRPQGPGHRSEIWMATREEETDEFGNPIFGNPFRLASPSHVASPINNDGLANFGPSIS